MPGLVSLPTYFKVDTVLVDATILQERGSSKGYILSCDCFSLLVAFVHALVLCGMKGDVSVG